jgi:hypothetical protein
MPRQRTGHVFLECRNVTPADLLFCLTEAFPRACAGFVRCDCVCVLVHPRASCNKEYSTRWDLQAPVGSGATNFGAVCRCRCARPSMDKSRVLENFIISLVQTRWHLSVAFACLANAAVCIVYLAL